MLKQGSIIVTKKATQSLSSCAKKIRANVFVLRLFVNRKMCIATWLIAQSRILHERETARGVKKGRTQSEQKRRERWIDRGSKADRKASRTIRRDADAIVLWLVARWSIVSSRPTHSLPLSRSPRLVSHRIVSYRVSIESSALEDRGVRVTIRFYRVLRAYVWYFITCQLRASGLNRTCRLARLNLAYPGICV